jgi:hypothetical protein
MLVSKPLITFFKVRCSFAYKTIFEDFDLMQAATVFKTSDLESLVVCFINCATTNGQ